MTVDSASERCWGCSPWLALWPPSPGRLAFYLDQLGDLLRAGMGMVEAMTQLAAYAGDRRYRRMSVELARGATLGEGLASQLRRYSQLIPPHVLGMIQAGERAGALPQVLQELAQELRAQQAQAWKVALGKAWFGAILVLAALSVPLGRIALGASVRSLNTEPLDEPPLARFMRVVFPEISHWFTHVVVPIALGLLVLSLLARVLFALPAWRQALQRWLYYVPVGRQLIQRAATIRFMVSLEALIKTGMEMSEALSVAAQTTGNIVLTEQLQRASVRIRNGTSLNEALRACSGLPAQVKDGLYVAERAGSYERSLGALIQGAREARSRTVLLANVTGYGVALLISGVATGIALGTGYLNYFNTILSAFDEP